MQNEIPKSSGSVQEPGFWAKHHQIICFYSAIVICCGIYVFAVCLQNHYLVERQNKIIQTFEAHIHEKSPLVNVPYNQTFNQCQVEQGKVFEEIKSMLDLEFNKVQNEFEALEIWAGILTVIFLIFSFYSLFKTEQMEQQSKAALRLINETQTKGDELIKTIEKDKVEKIKSIDDLFKNWSDKKGKAIKILLDNKSKKYQIQLTQDYKVNFDSKVAEISEQFNKMAQESITSSERIMGEEMQKFIETWNTKMEHIVADYLKKQKESVATKEDVDKLYEEESEDELGDVGVNIDNTGQNIDGTEKK